jgi:hypothetical protein
MPLPDTTHLNTFPNTDGVYNINNETKREGQCEGR